MAQDIAVQFRLGVTGSTRKAVEGIKNVGRQAKITQRLMNGFKAAAASLAAPLLALGSITAIKTLTLDLINFGDKLDKVSQRVNVLPEDLQRWSRSAELAGTSFATLERGLRNLNKNMEQAASGAKPYAEAFERLGVSITNQDGSLRDVADVFRDVADATKRMGSSAETSADLMQILGVRAGPELTPLLNQGREGLDAFSASIGPDFAKNSATFNDNLAKAKFALQDVALKILDAILPALIEMQEGLAAMGKYLQENESAAIVLKTALAILVTPIVAVVEAVKGLTVGLRLIFDVIEAIRNADVAGIFRAIGNAIRRVGETAARAAKSFRNLFAWATRGNQAAAQRPARRRQPKQRPTQEQEAPVDKELAIGGVVRGPTRALIGEAGPEAVVPLSGGRSIPVVIQGPGGEPAAAANSATVTIHQTVNMTSTGGGDVDNSALLRKMASISEQAVERGLHRAGF